MSQELLWYAQGPTLAEPEVSVHGLETNDKLSPYGNWPITLVGCPEGLRLPRKRRRGNNEH